MKNYQNKAGDYQTPVCLQMKIKAEGVLCGSGEDASFINENFENITYTQGTWA